MLCGHAGHSDYKRAIDLSPGGICLRTSMPYAVDVRLRLDFLLPGDESPIVCGARIRNVMSSRPPRMNLEFVTIDPRDQARIVAYLDRQRGTTSTARNWRTVAKLAEMAGC